MRRTPARIRTRRRLMLLSAPIALVLVALEGRARGRAAAYRVGGGSARPAPVSRLGRWRVPAVAVALAVVVAALVIPLIALGDWLLAAGARWDGGQWSAAVVPSTWWASSGPALKCLRCTSTNSSAARLKYAATSARASWAAP